MLNSVALQVVIGLIFIYLLYSLLATVLSEMIASLLGLRARNLKNAIGRMLKSPDNAVLEVFYNNPEIKSAGGKGRSRNPSFIKAASFSKVLVEILSGGTPASGDKISAVLKVSAQTTGCNGSALPPGALEAEAAIYILRLWDDAGGDILKFKLLVEEWFNRIMVQASEWYKRRIRLVLLILGFCMAWFFYADTFTIVRKLSVDKDAREKMVVLAETYARANPAGADTSMMEAKQKLASDMLSANSILGLGGWLPDRVSVAMDPKTKEKTYTPELDPRCLSTSDLKISNGKILLSFGEKIGYLFKLAWYHFFGFLLTAVAVSLGAPFWFDLLNKVMKFRTSHKE
jgi:hypothetical protein